VLSASAPLSVAVLAWRESFNPRSHMAWLVRRFFLCRGEGALMTVHLLSPCTLDRKNLIF
jgi:hypothetical protein